MRGVAFLLSSVILMTLAIGSASAVMRSETFERSLLPGESLVIAYDERWGPNITLRFESDLPADLYVVRYPVNLTNDTTIFEGTVLDNATVLCVLENLTGFSFDWDAPGNLTYLAIVIDNVDGPSAHDAASSLAVKVRLTVEWEEEVPADLFLMVFCCGSIIVFTALLMYAFVRFLIRRPPRPHLEGGTSMTGAARGGVPPGKEKASRPTPRGPRPPAGVRPAGRDVPGTGDGEKGRAGEDAGEEGSEGGSPGT
ncbi:MAG TPA: hypothetical protein EYP43_01045 [Thermoplasmata archaeon]|nr:hypothetical protein [Thermoplasmata archaeon]